jgi:two-component system response regulator CpxR
MAEKILVIEDDQFLRDLYNELLTEDGYEVNLAEDGEAGMNKFIAGGYDLVLLDIMLPKVDGLEILRKVKEKPPNAPNGPVVLLTNLGQDSIIKEGFKLGASGYLIKSSMNPDQVLSEVKVFLRKSNISKDEANQD